MRRLLTRFRSLGDQKLQPSEVGDHPTSPGHHARENRRRAATCPPDMTPPDRLMAALILVFGQQTHKVVALQWGDINTVDGALAVTLGKHPVILEHPLDDLVAAVRSCPTNRQTASNAKSRWVFPGYAPGHHLNAGHVRIRLNKLGFPSLATRIGTWQSHRPPRHQSWPTPWGSALSDPPRPTRFRPIGVYVADRRTADKAESSFRRLDRPAGQLVGHYATRIGERLLAESGRRCG
jgi:hypothetical protein